MATASPAPPAEAAGHVREQRREQRSVSEHPDEQPGHREKEHGARHPAHQEAAGRDRHHPQQGRSAYPDPIRPASHRDPAHPDPEHRDRVGGDGLQADDDDKGCAPRRGSGEAARPTRLPMKSVQRFTMPRGPLWYTMRQHEPDAIMPAKPRPPGHRTPPCHLAGGPARHGLGGECGSLVAPIVFAPARGAVVDRWSTGSASRAVRSGWLATRRGRSAGQPASRRIRRRLVAPVVGAAGRDPPGPPGGRSCPPAARQRPKRSRPFGRSIRSIEKDRSSPTGRILLELTVARTRRVVRIRKRPTSVAWPRSDSAGIADEGERTLRNDPGERTLVAAVDLHPGAHAGGGGPVRPDRRRSRSAPDPLHHLHPVAGRVLGRQERETPPRSPRSPPPPGPATGGRGRRRSRWSTL